MISDLRPSNILQRFSATTVSRAFLLLSLLFLSSLAATVRADRTYTFVIVSRSNTEVLRYSHTVAEASLSQAVALHPGLISPSATNLHYYSTQAAAYANDGASSLLDGPFSSVSDGTTIYVGYDYDGGAHIDLSGSTKYALKRTENSTDYYLQGNTISNHIGTWNNTDDAGDDSFRWTLNGSDPYRFEVRSALFPDYFLSCAYNDGVYKDGHDGTQYRLYNTSTPEVRYVMLLSGNKWLFVVHHEGQQYAMYVNDSWSGQWFKIYGGKNPTTITSYAELTDLFSKMYSVSMVTKHSATFHIVDAAGVTKETVEAPVVSGEALVLPNRAKFKRVGCTLSEKYYTDPWCTKEATTDNGSTTDYYIPYTFCTTDAERAELEKVNVVFSTEDAPVWKNLSINNRFFSYDSSNNQFKVITNDPKKVSEGDRVAPEAHFALIGDPYAFKLICEAATYTDGVGVTRYQQAYLDTGTNTVRMMASPSDNVSTWSMDPGHNEARFQVHQNGHSNVVTRSFWNPKNDGTPMVMYDMEDSPKNDVYLETLTNFTHTFHMVSKLGEVALSKRVADFTDPSQLIWEVFPSVLKTALIVDDADHYKFFNTQAEAHAFTADGTSEGAITTRADVTGTDIYVGYRYNPDEAPEGAPDMSGQTFYLVYYDNGSTAQCYAMRDFETSNGTLYTHYHWRSNVSPTANQAYLDCFLWSFTGDDPYSFQMVNKSSGYPLGFAQTSTNWSLDSNYGNASGYNRRFFILQDATGSWNIGQVNSSVAIAGTTYIRWLGTNGSTNTNVNLQVQANDNDNTNPYVKNRTHASLTIKTYNYNYVFNIVDNSGRIAIKCTGEHAVGGALKYTSIPKLIRSPYLKDETLTFYDSFTEGDLASLEGHETSVAPSRDGADIYVRYTTDHLRDFALTLGGARSFDVRMGGNYVYDESLQLKSKPTVTATEEDDQRFLWYFKGQDPYALYVENVADKRYVAYDTSTLGVSLTTTLSPAASAFIVKSITTSTRTVDGEEIEDIQVELMAATGQDAATAAGYYHLGRGSDDADPVSLFDNATPSGSSQLQVVLNVAKLHISYCLLDLGGRVVMEIPTDDASEKNFPAEWRSPLATDYSYWIRENFSVTGDVYTLLEGQTQIESLAESSDGKVYVTYSPTTDVDLDGRKRTEAGQNGQLYMLEFLDGASFLQENGKDGLNASPTKAVYPYSNGEANLYIYGKEQWSGQQLEAASTRTRWAWYVEGGDPYRARFSSFQSQAGSNTYLRTYRPEGYGQVVTGVTTLNEAVTQLDAAEVPTEYMILGTTDAFVLKTTEPIDGEHVAVTSLEQYWKNNPTALNVLLAQKGIDPGTSAGKAAAEAYAEELNTRQLTAEEQSWLEAKGWHTYKAWANVASWTTTSGKTYQHGDHWFQTISMGDGSMKLTPVSLDGVLVLLDNHGWEIMRKPLARQGALDADSRNDAIRAYDSPLVAQYHFWYNYSKLPGYHKYSPAKEQAKPSDNAQHVGSGTSLADYTNFYAKLTNNGTLRDVYVTYDVKPQFNDPEATFVVRQGSRLALTADGTTITTEDATPIDAGNIDLLSRDDLQWRLVANADIDDEMGIVYSYLDITKSKEEMLADYEASGKSGFDPYNMRIQHKLKGTYFVTSATSATLEGGGWTSPAEAGLHLTADASAQMFTAVGHDATTCRVTNATFMAVADANGNMRLMPRFDHNHVVEGFTALATKAAAQPADDVSHPQTTRLYQPSAFTYIVIDNSGREALRYTLVSSGAPDIPYKFVSPLATAFRFYKNLTPDDGGVYDLSDISSNQIKGSFASEGMTGGNVYVRYAYDEQCDPLGLLHGRWLTMSVGGADVRLRDGAVKSDGTKTATDANWQWRLTRSASDVPDPYAVSLYSAAAGTTAVAVDGQQRFVLLPHSSGEADDYAIMAAGTKTTSDYSFVGLRAPSTTVSAQYEAGFAVSGTLADAAKVKFAADVEFESIRYKIVTSSGQIALTGDSLLYEGRLRLPHWMRSPLMKMDDDTYTYFAGLTQEGDRRTAVYPTSNTGSLDIEDGHAVVYVRYDYEKSKQVFNNTNFGEVAQYFSPATLDLSGKVGYVLTIGGGHNWGKIDEKDHVVLRSVGQNNNHYQDRFKDEYLVEFSWLLTGQDPYEITFTNPAYGNSAYVLSAKEPETAVDPDKETDIIANDTLKMAPLDDETYIYHTFMLLRGARDDVKLKLYVTGHDDLFLSENGVLRVWKDKKRYEQRVFLKAEPSGRREYSRFGYRPNIVYHVITNDGREAFRAHSARGSDHNQETFGLPQFAQSPLLNETDFEYYTERPVWDGSKLSVDEASRIGSDVSTAVEAVERRIGHVYVRYHYNRETSPFMIGTKIDTSAPTFLDWTDAAGLDLSGQTWYTMACLQRNVKTALKAASATACNKGEIASLSAKEYLWRFEGDDPYAIRIYNCQYPDGVSADTYMLLQAHAMDNEAGDFLESGGYPLKRWSILYQTGTCMMASTQDMKLREPWYPQSIDKYDIRFGQGDEGLKQREIFSMGSGGTTDYCWEFVKAPVARKYHYHAIRYDNSGTRIGQTWDAVMEHDWLLPVTMEDQIARLMCKYEKYGTDGSFLSREDLTADRVGGVTFDARFYHDEALTQPVYDESSSTADVYPEISTDEVYDIYFKYQVDETAAAKFFSTETAIANDLATHKAHSGLGGQSVEANWKFMVLDTDEGLSHATVGGNDVTTGQQYFLRREDNGLISWLDGVYRLRPDEAGPASRNYPHTVSDTREGYSYTRVAESFREGQNEPFREGRWLWAFTGEPYNMKVLNMEALLGVVAAKESGYSLAAKPDAYVSTWSRDADLSAINGQSAFYAMKESGSVFVPQADTTCVQQSWGLCPGTDGGTFTLQARETSSDTQPQPLYWQMTTPDTGKGSVALSLRANGYQNDIKPLPYVPVQYQDVVLTIRRMDSCVEDPKGEKGTGTKEVYYAQEDRMFAAGDMIDNSEAGFPLMARRQFCTYKFWTDQFITPGSAYTVWDSSWLSEDGITVDNYDQDPRLKPGQYAEMARRIDGEWRLMQSVYVSYAVTDEGQQIFISPDNMPTKEDELRQMLRTNDHVFFMDFPSATRNILGTYTAHAYCEKSDFSNISEGLTHDYHTDPERMYARPEQLKWYFVGDPYNVQVFSAMPEHLGQNLCRIPMHALKPSNVQTDLPNDGTQQAGTTRWQYVHDCLQMAKPSTRADDNRLYMARRNRQTGQLEYYKNPNNPAQNPSYKEEGYTGMINPVFKWEMVPAASGQPGSFALRYVDNETQLSYRGVYYYLHPGYKRTYEETINGEKVERSYEVDMAYNPGNDIYTDGDYVGYHRANQPDCAISLVRPAKVFVSIYKKGGAENVTTDELSEYFGVGETLTEMPRHLRRAYAQYFGNSDCTAPISYELGEDNRVGGDSLKACTEHGCKSASTNYVYRLKAYYTPLEGVFSQWNAGSGQLENVVWNDIRVANLWLYYDVNAHRSGVSPSREDNVKVVRGSTDGAPLHSKGYHWALVGDPYSFVAVNRRIYEENLTAGNQTTSAGWLIMPPSGSAIGSHPAGTPYMTMGEKASAQTFSFQYSRMYFRNSQTLVKTGDDIFLRTASPKTSVGDFTTYEGYTFSGQHNNETSDYQYVYLLDNRSNMSVNLDKTSSYEFAEGLYSWFILRDYTLSTKANTDGGYDRSISDNPLKSAYLRTVEQDDVDDVYNDCFDAHIRVYNPSTGQLMHETCQVEMSFTDLKKNIDISAVIPAEVRRYGCSYKVYTERTAPAGSTLMGTLSNQVYSLADVAAGTAASATELDEDFTAALMTTSDACGEPKSAKKHVDLYLTYTVNAGYDSLFTDPKAAGRDEYIWVNSYYGWNQSYTGTGSTVTEAKEVDDYDNPLLNDDGLIIGWNKKTVYYTHQLNGTTVTVEVRGYLNVKSGDDEHAGSVYGDERTREDSGTAANDQKWSYVGDPYSFQMRNYSLYLSDGTGVLMQGEGSSVSTGAGDSKWTVKVDANGTPYLALIDQSVDAPAGSISGYATFDRARNSHDLDWTQQYLYVAGEPTTDPTGQALNAGSAHPFYLIALNSYASVIVYHLVIGHQHQQYNYDHADECFVTRYDGESDAQRTARREAWEKALKEHIDEVARYNAIHPGGVTATSLRDVVRFPVEDYAMERVGVGNTLTIPWYMKRQFCQYTLYLKAIQKRKMVEEGDADYDDSRALRNDSTGVLLTNSSGKHFHYGWEDDEEAMAVHKDVPVSRVEEYFKDKRVELAVVYNVDTRNFRFSTDRTTTAWYSMLNQHTETVDGASQPLSGLMNFSYSEGIGARLDRTAHYTNNYLWAPVGDPYGFVLHNRYATNNGTGWDNVVVTTAEWLPSKHFMTNGQTREAYDGCTEVAGVAYSPFKSDTGTELKADGESLTYTSAAGGLRFVDGRVSHQGRGEERPASAWSGDGDPMRFVATDGAHNAVYEMMTSDYERAFLMHPTADYIDPTDANHTAFYVTHEINPSTGDHSLRLRMMNVQEVRAEENANWRLETTPEQLLPYFQRSGYVGGLQPTLAAQSTYLKMRTQLEQYVKGGTLYGETAPFSLLDDAREMVYKGLFRANRGTGAVIVKDVESNKYFEADDEGNLSSTEAADHGTFVSTNLVGMRDGYFRIQAFSVDAINSDGADVDRTGLKGIVGPRYISGYRHLSEKDGMTAPDGTLYAGNRWLHFYETTEEAMNSSLGGNIHTFAELNTLIESLHTKGASGYHNRDIDPHPALSGNIEILPVEYDPSSIFLFQGVSGDAQRRYTFGTQGLRVRARAGGIQPHEGTGEYGVTPESKMFGRTLLADRSTAGLAQDMGTDGGWFDDRWVIDDIGGTAVTLRLITDNDGTETTDVGENIKHNYLCIDANHRYRITVHTDNEMYEIGDHQSHGFHGIQDTKWMLQPIQDRAQRDTLRHDMPLRLQVNRGGVKDATGYPDYANLLNDAMREANQDQNYYSSLYVPFDTRLVKTTDNAFTYAKDELPQLGDPMNMNSLGLLTGTNNGQYVPAAWPVIVRTGQPQSSSTIDYMERPTAESRMFAELYLPFADRPEESFKPLFVKGAAGATSGYAEAGGNTSMRGEYLEQTLTGVADGKVMVFGLPISSSDFGHDYGLRVGFYKNMNWQREAYPQRAAHGSNAATTAERSNLYVSHNKVYIVDAAPSGSRRYIPVVFDGEPLSPEEPLSPTDADVKPWPCDVYNLQGQRVAENETPSTLLKNHPSLPKGVYLFGGHKVVVK